MQGFCVVLVYICYNTSNSAVPTSVPFICGLLKAFQPIVTETLGLRVSPHIHVRAHTCGQTECKRYTANTMCLNL